MRAALCMLLCAFMMSSCSTQQSQTPMGCKMQSCMILPLRAICCVSKQRRWKEPRMLLASPWAAGGQRGCKQEGKDCRKGSITWEQRCEWELCSSAQHGERACSQSWAKGRGSVGEEAERIENLITCCVKWAAGEVPTAAKQPRNWRNVKHWGADFFWASQRSSALAGADVQDVVTRTRSLPAQELASVTLADAAGLRNREALPLPTGFVVRFSRGWDSTSEQQYRAESSATISRGWAMLHGFNMGRCGTGMVPLPHQAELTKEMEQRSTEGITALPLLEAHISPSCRFAHDGHCAVAVRFLELSCSYVRIFCSLLLHTRRAAGKELGGRQPLLQAEPSAGCCTHQTGSSSTKQKLTAQTSSAASKHPEHPRFSRFLWGLQKLREPPALFIQRSR